MSIANYLETRILDAVLNNTSLAITSVYVALHTADPTDTGTVGEVSGSAYARTIASFGAAASGAASNDADVTFPEASGSWGTITHVSLWDASSAGNCLWTGALAASRSVTSGITFRIPTSDLDVSVD